LPESSEKHFPANYITENHREIVIQRMMEYKLDPSMMLLSIIVAKRKATEKKNIHDDILRQTNLHVNEDL